MPQGEIWATWIVILVSSYESARGIRAKTHTPVPLVEIPVGHHQAGIQGWSWTDYFLSREDMVQKAGPDRRARVTCPEHVLVQQDGLHAGVLCKVLSNGATGGQFWVRRKSGRVHQGESLLDHCAEPNLLEIHSFQRLV